MTDEKKPDALAKRLRAISLGVLDDLAAEEPEGSAERMSLESIRALHEQLPLASELESEEEPKP